MFGLIKKGLVLYSYISGYFVDDASSKEAMSVTSSYPVARTNEFLVKDYGWVYHTDTFNECVILDQAPLRSLEGMAIEVVEKHPNDFKISATLGNPLSFGSSWLSSTAFIAHQAIQYSPYVLVASYYPLLGAGVLLAERFVGSLAQQQEDVYSESYEMTERLKARPADFTVRDIAKEFTVKDMTERYRTRLLQQGTGPCVSGIVPIEGWVQTLGGTASDGGNALVLRPDGQAVVIGYIQNYPIVGLNILLAQFYTNGTLEWAKVFGGVHDDFGNALVLRQDGRIIITGYYTYNYGTRISDVLLAQFYANGTLEWAQTVGGVGNDEGYAIALQSDGRIVVTGFTKSFGAGLEDVLLMQFYANGTLEWARTVGGIGSEGGSAIALRPDGRVIVTGSTTSFGAGLGDVLLMQFYANGTLEWARTVGGIGSDAGSAIALQSDGRVIVTGFTTSFGAGSNDVLLAQFYINGTLEWARTLGGIGSDAGNALVLRPDGRIVVTGYTDSFGAGHEDVFLMQFYANGAIEWAKTFGGISSDLGRALVLRPDGRLMVTGYIYSIGAGNDDILLVQLDVNQAVSFPASSFLASNVNPSSMLILPNSTSVLPTVNNITSMTVVSSIIGLNSMDITNSNIKTEASLMANSGSEGDELNVPLNYLWRYALYPNGPFTGVLNPAISVDLSKTPWLKYDFVNRVLYGIPLFDSLGSYFVQFSVSGQGTKNVGSMFGIVELNICVQNFDYRVPTYFRYALNPWQTAVFNHLYQFNFTDLLFPGATVNAVSGHEGAVMPSWLTYNSSLQLLRGEPRGLIRGNYLVDVSFSSGGSVADTVTLVVNVPNTAPYYTGNAMLNTTTGRFVFRLGSAFQDDENDRLSSYGIALLNDILPPPIASIDSISGRLFGTALSGDQGVYSFNITATDPYGGMGWQVVTLSILNRAPIVEYLFTDPDPLSVGHLFQYTFPSNAFVDPDGDVVNYAAVYPSFLNFNPGMRLLSGMPARTNRGNYTVTFSSVDPYGGQVNASIFIRVVNSAPIAVGAIYDQQVSAQESSFTFSIPIFNDPDGDNPVTYHAEMQDGSPLPVWLQFDQVGRLFSASPNQAAAGSYHLSVLATDALGLSQKMDFNLAIQAPPNIDLSTNSTKDILKNVAPVLAGVGLLVLISSMLLCRQRRIRDTNRRVRKWSTLTHARVSPSTELVEFASLSRDLTAIGTQLAEAAALVDIESKLMQFEQKLRLYYAQDIKHEPMTTLLDSLIVEKLMKFVERNVLETHHKDYDSERTFGAARLLHSFLGMVLSEHTGRKHKLSQETKELYLNRLNKLISRLNSRGREAIEILYELHSAREALICTSDTNTLFLLCKASVTHILSPGGLLKDLKRLAFDIPSNWYVLLLELMTQVAQAQTDIVKLTEIQSIAAKQTDWRFLYGMISVLLNIIANTTDPSIRTQAIKGQNRACGIALLGLIQILQTTNSWLCCHQNTWVRRQAKWALNEAGVELRGTDRELLGPYLTATPMSRPARKSMITTPLDALASTSQVVPARRVIAVAEDGSVAVSNPLHDGGSVATTWMGTPLSAARASVVSTTADDAVGLRTVSSPLRAMRINRGDKKILTATSPE